MLPRLPCMLCQLPEILSHKFLTYLLSFIPPHPHPPFYFSNMQCCNNNNSNNNSNNILYSSQWEIKAVIGFYTLMYNEELQIILSHFFKVMKHTHIHIIRHTPPCLSIYILPSKPKITWSNVFSDKPQPKNSQVK